MQNDLFDAPPVATPRARRRDPKTSHEAATAASFASEHCERIHAALRSLGPATIYELAARTGLDHVAVARRMTDLERATLAARTAVMRPGPSGRQCMVWRAA